MSTGIGADISDVYARYGLPFEPNEMQQELYGLICDRDHDCAELLKAPPGSGKTEAVVVPALDAKRRLFLVFPTRSLLQDQELRISAMLAHRSQQDPARVYSLVVDTGAAMYRRVWARGEEHYERRHLLHGDVVLTTLDKLLYRFFGFGEERKGYTYPLRLRYGRRPLFCFDEAHSYDDISFFNFVDLVKAIGFNTQAPSDLIVMTATMPEAYVHELALMLTVRDYTNPVKAARLMPWAKHPEKGVELRETPEELAGEALRACVREEALAAVLRYHQPGQRTIVVMEEVREAVTVYERLQISFPNAGNDSLFLYHGRQAASVRSQVYSGVKARDDEPREQGRGYLLVTTSAIEVGCDLDADTLITELCNPEQLIQRAGRCNRRGQTHAGWVVVIGRKIPEYLRTLPKQHMDAYMGLLREMATAGTYDASRLLKLGRRPARPDYRVRTMFDMLYGYVYEAERANKPLHDKGLVVTRSWEPVVTLAVQEHDGTLKNELEIGISSCCAHGSEELTPNCRVYVRRFDEERRKWVLQKPTHSGSAYSAEIVVIVPHEYIQDAVLGYVDPPKVFRRTRPRGYQHGVIYRHDDADTPAEATGRQGEGDAKAKVVYWWYLADLPRSAEEAGALDDVNGNDFGASEPNAATEQEAVTKLEDEDIGEDGDE